jgi:hypothetical protein
MPDAFDPKVILAILGTGVFSLIGIALWLWRYKKDAQDEAIREREALQLRSDQERNREANEHLLTELEKIPDEIPDRVDPADPWAGLR